MKTTTFLLMFLGIVFIAEAQDSLSGVLPLKEGKVTYTGIVQIDSVSKSDLFVRAKQWFVNSYNSAKDVIQMEDKENGVIIGKGFFKANWQVTFYAYQTVNVWQTVKVYVKDGKFRYEITDFEMKYHVSASQYTSATDIDRPLEVWNRDREANCKKFYPKIDENVISTINSLKAAMKVNSISNW